jgi:hypothetical protein
MCSIQSRAPLLAAALSTAALAAPPLASAYSADGHGRAAVVPVHRVAEQSAGEFLTRPFVRGYEASADAPPPPTDPCEIVGERHRALIYKVRDEPPTCTVRVGTPVVVSALSVACSDVEPPPFFGADEAAQRACDLAWASSVTEYRIGVDQQPSVDVDTERFAAFSPSTTVEIPPDSLFGLPAGPATFVAYGWSAQVRGFCRGRHTISVHVAGADFDEHSAVIVDVE